MTKTTTKPRQSKDFPLTQRSDGRWQKKVHGRVHYFRGSRKEVLEEWLLLRTSRNLGTPVVDGLDLRIKESA